MVMTEFWHWWVVLLTGISLVLCFWIITINLKNYTHVDEGESMGHEFDGIEELNNPLPKWWTYMFYFILVWSVGYLILYPGMGNYQGLLGWKSSNQGIVTLAESKELSDKAKAEGLLVPVVVKPFVAPPVPVIPNTGVLDLEDSSSTFFSSACVSGRSW